MVCSSIVARRADNGGTGGIGNAPGYDSNSYAAGLIAGDNYGNITNCYATGNITFNGGVSGTGGNGGNGAAAASTTGGQGGAAGSGNNTACGNIYVAGLIAYNYGSRIISSYYKTGTISITGTTAGSAGIAGNGGAGGTGAAGGTGGNGGSGSVTVTASWMYAAGLVAYNFGSIQNC